MANKKINMTPLHAGSNPTELDIKFTCLQSIFCKYYKNDIRDRLLLIKHIVYPSNYQ